MKKATAVHEGNGYCATCYMREFKQISCSECGKTVRTYHGQGPVVCKSCKTIGRICIRCKKLIEKRRIGLIVDDGPVCNSCARYFRPPKQCPECGAISYYLARDLKLGFTEPVCEKCRRSKHATCSKCRKHRQVAEITDKGKPICKECLLQIAPFICPKCGKEGIRHGKHHCSNCYWDGYVARKTQEHTATFKHEWVKELYVLFIQELLGKLDSHNVAIRMRNRYFPMFKMLDDNFDHKENITAESLSDIYSSGKLIRTPVFLNFLVRQSILTKDHSKIIDAGEYAKQRRILDKAHDRWFYQLLVDYQTHLHIIHERYVSRGWIGVTQRFVKKTLTTSMGAAFSFLNTLPERIKESTEIDQQEVTHFLGLYRGSRNSIRSFIRFMKIKKKTFRKLEIVSIKNPLANRLFLGDKRYEELVSAWLHPDDDSLKYSLASLFMLFYGQTAKNTASIKMGRILQVENGYRIAFGKAPVLLHPLVACLLERYLEQRSSLNIFDDITHNPYLFPGRVIGNHLTPENICLFLKKHNVRADILFSTALFKAFHGGINNPRIVADSFGITFSTSVKYYKLINPDVRAELETEYARF